MTPAFSQPLGNPLNQRELSQPHWFCSYVLAAGFGGFGEQDTPLRFICKLLSGRRWGIRYVINRDTGIEKGRARQPERDYNLINSRDTVSCYQCEFNAVSSCAVGNGVRRGKAPKSSWGATGPSAISRASQKNFPR